MAAPEVRQEPQQLRRGAVLQQRAHKLQTVGELLRGAAGQQQQTDDLHSLLMCELMRLGGGGGVQVRVSKSGPSAVTGGWKSGWETFSGGCRRPKPLLGTRGIE